MYAVVEFKAELKNEVEVVASKWITESKKQCWWPEYKSSSRIIEAVIKRENVNPTKYKLYDARVMKYCDKFADAKANAKTAEEESDLNSESESTPKLTRLRCVSRRVQILPTSDDDEMEEPSHRLVLVEPSNSSEMLPPRPPLASTSSAATGRPNASLSVDMLQGISAIDKPEPAKISDTVECLDISQQNSATSNFQNWMVRQVGIMKAQMKNLQESVDILVDARNGESAPKRHRPADNEIENKLSALLPLKQMDDVDSFLNEILNEEMRNAMVAKLGRRGGTDLKDCVRRILSSLLTDAVAINFSWLGSRGDKRSFASSELKNILYDAVRRTPKMSESMDVLIEDTVKDWLKNAKKRISKKQPTNNTIMIANHSNEAA